MTPFILLACCVAMTWVVYRKGGPLTPSAALAISSTYSLAVFYASYATGVDYWTVEYGGFSIHKYADIVDRVFFAYSMFVLSALLGILGVRPREARRLDVVSDKAREVLSRVLESRATHYLVLALFLVSIWHMFIIDKANLWENNEYLTISTASRMNITNPVLLVVHAAMGPICLFTMCVAYLFFKHRRVVNGVLCLLVFSYFFLLELAAFSRIVAFACALMAVLLAVERKACGRRVLGPSTVAALVGTVWMFLYAVSARNTSLQGIVGIIPNLFLANLQYSDLEFLYVNPAQGPFVLAEALVGGPYDYPLSYKLTSFSVFLSYIDGFAGMMDYQHRVNWCTPFNVSAELYYFGTIYQIAFALILITCLRILNKSAMSITGSAGFFLSALPIYALIYMHQYPIRNSFRVLIYVTILTILTTRRQGRPHPAAARRFATPASSAPRPPAVPR